MKLAQVVLPHRSHGNSADAIDDPGNMGLCVRVCVCVWLRGCVVPMNSHPQATTAVDIVPRTREKVVNDIVKFLATDSVCFFADPKEEPGLREMQEEAFFPIINWVRWMFMFCFWTHFRNSLSSILA